ncbi:MAG: hypothetical protein KGH63_03170, partial [Candidatus Micrarchaeota archaeon]|nr:hypothetical protein [Candidatus Micrarchaeota archaeon]
ARLVLDTFQKDWGSKIMMSDEIKASLAAKDQLSAYRQEQIALLHKGRLTPEDRARLAELRSLIPEQIRFVREQEAAARRANKEGFWADRELKGVADMNIPFFNIAEMTVMRDPRFAFGGGHGMGPAVMVGYQTGQFVGERPNMWAGYHIGPGDRVLNILAQPAYVAAMGFGMSTRSFFSKMTGYTTIYHMDPEKGPHGGTGHEGGLVQAFQSLFRPSESNDWLTRLYLRPMLRTKYRDEYGFSAKDEATWAGERFTFPVSWKYGGGGKARGVDSAYAVDESKYQQMGQDASEEMRRRKLGLTFREEYTLWDKRYAASNREQLQSSIDALRGQLALASDSAERRIIKSEIRELSDTLRTDRAAWHIPGISALFRQGYYAVENRAGYDISAAGGAHRPYEMSNPWFKNTGRVNIPGMFYQDWEGGGSSPHLQVFPRVARTLVNSPKEILATLPERIGMEGDAGGVGRELRRDALRDVFRHDTPFLSKFMELEMERLSYSFTNSPYIIPLAPLYVIAYQQLKKSAWGKRQPWSTEAPGERELGPLSDDERRQEALMRGAQAREAGLGHTTYRCPAHGLELSTREACPLCRSQAQYEAEAESKLPKRYSKIKEAAKNWIESSTPFTGYTHYYNQSHCPHHGIAYDRGTACPLCLQDQVKKAGGPAAARADAFMREVGDINRQLKAVAADRTMHDEERAREMDRLLAEREKLGEAHGLQVERDRRMGYRESKDYIRSQIALIRETEKKQAAKFE